MPIKKLTSSALEGYVPENITHLSFADIFRQSADTEEFRKAVRLWRGTLSLEPEAIIELGNAYLERFPGCVGNEECDDVRDAYEIAKICAIEYLCGSVDDALVDQVRQAFLNVKKIAAVSEKLKDAIGYQGFASLLALLSTRAEALHDIIKTLPPCIIKERFSGALAYVTNVIYLMGIEVGIS